MQKNRLREKLIAMILIFTMTFANFAFVSKAYASSFTDFLFGNGSDTGSRNIAFDANLEIEGESGTSIVSDVNNTNLAIGMMLSVENNGYLRDSQINILETEEGAGLNFKIKEIEELPEFIQSIEDNTIYLQQIGNSEDIFELRIPIEYVNEEYFDETNLSKDFKVLLTGIYVTGKGDEKEISKEVTLNLTWKDERQGKVETEITKYIDFGDGVIIQTKVSLDSKVEENTLPIKETELTIQAPTYFDNLPTNVYVLANSTQGTNGKGYGETEFDESNWEYNQEDNLTTIRVRNDKQLVEINNDEDTIQEIDREIVEAERYYNLSGLDEFLITYTYKNVKITDEEVLINSNIEEKITVLGQEDEDAIASSENYEYKLAEKTGDIISISREADNEDISKAYFYANKNNDIYEVLFDSTTIVNVSYKDIVDGIEIEDTNNLYVDKLGNTYENDDIYYKQIIVGSSNLQEILGEDGEIKITDLEDGQLDITINKDSDVDENGNIVTDIEGDYSKLKIETTSPVNEGNLVINNIKGIQDISLEKGTIVELEKITDETVVRAKYDYVEDKVEVGSAGTESVLTDTETRANIKLENNVLSTTEKNTEFKMTIELNNASDKSDIYGHTEFYIEFPEYVENIEISNCSIGDGDGLEITSAQVEDRTIKVVLDGKQNGINANYMTNGARIELTLNVEVDMFTPATTGLIKMRTTNAEATNYNNEGLAEALLVFSAPTGLVVANSVYNFDDEGTYLTSIRQGKKEGKIDIYSSSRIVGTEIVVMNNNQNNVSNVVILGRFPYEGVRDILNDDDLGTTQNVKITRGLISDERNNEQFKIYYSENPEATRDLEDETNGWNENPENIENMKSYLIVPQNEEYIMEPEQNIRFTYEYEVPENLPHNENIYGTVVAYYRNLSEVAQINCQEVADLVGLTTGEGPEIDLQITTSETEINEYQEFDVKVVATNVGDTDAEDVKVTLEEPDGVDYVSREVKNGEENWEDFNLKLSSKELYDLAVQKGKVSLLTRTLRAGYNLHEYPYEVTNKRLKPGEKIEFTITYRTQELPAHFERIYVTEIPEDISDEEKAEYVSEADIYYKEVINKEPEKSYDFTSIVTAKDMETGNTKTSESMKVVPAEIVIQERNDEHTKILIEGELINFYTTIINKNDFPLTDVTVTKDIPEGLVFNDAYISDVKQENLGASAYGYYNQETRQVSWNIKKINSGEAVNIKTILEGGKITNGLDIIQVKLNTVVTSNEIKEVKSSPTRIGVGRPVLTIIQEEPSKTNVKEGEKIDYRFTVKNEGTVPAYEVKLTDRIPEGIYPTTLTYGFNEQEISQSVSAQREIVVNTNIAPNSVLNVKVSAIVGKIDDNPEKVNYGTVLANNFDEITSEGVTYIVEPGENSVESAKPIETSKGSSNNNSNKTDSNYSSKYKLTGLAWFDENRDGMRSSTEKGMGGLTVRLISGREIVQTQTTDSSGKYTFSDVENGTYLVLFDFDSEKYKLTTYKKSGVASNTNSDFTSTEINQDGKTRQGAVTEQIIISGSSVTGIDMGLIYADTFDLKIDKSIAKVTVQTMKGTTTENYDNSKIVKTEIAAKNLTGAIVYVEYNITVSNVGDVSGFARKLVDYLPEGMTFNSSLGSNSDWYTGSDGNLYTDVLANKELAKGESATLKLVLTRQMTEENTDVVSNLVEIYQDYNKKGIEDINSKAGNKAQGENDMSSADIAIMVKTGEELIYFSVIATTVTLGMIVIFVTYTKITSRKKKIIE